MLEHIIESEVSNVADNQMSDVSLADDQISDIANLIAQGMVPSDVFSADVSLFETLTEEDDWSEVNNSISATIHWYLNQ